jgi:large subunit ribosomal protein L25
MATPLALTARTRQERGRHVHVLRRHGEVPAILYGHNTPAVALSLDAHALERVWHRAGHSHLVDLALDGGRPRKVLIRELQVSPRTTRLVHVDLFAVNLREKLTVEVPVVPVGESPAVAVEKIGVLQQIMGELKIECLPGDIPAQITVDVSGLVAIDDGVHIRDLVLPQGVSLAQGVNPDELVVKVSAVRVAVEEEEEAAAAEAEGEEAAGEEGAAQPAAEGAPSEE